MSDRFENVSLFIIGTELTMGIIGDKHVQTISSELTRLGFCIRRAVIVPDDGSIGSSMKPALEDSDVILVTGGLGPTSDDMTRQVIADAAGVRLLKNQDVWDSLHASMGDRIYGSNETQTYIPEGFTPVANPHGTACGFKGVSNIDGRKVFFAAMPGPPKEMQPMFFNEIMPSLAELAGHDMPQRDEYSVYLIAEAKLEELCKACADAMGDHEIEWGTRFQMFKICLYVSGSTAQNRALFISALRSMVGEDLVSDGNHEASDLLLETLKDKGQSIAFAEDATGGCAVKTMTDLPDSFLYVHGGWTGFMPDALSIDTVAQAAMNIRQSFMSDIGVAVNGTTCEPSTPEDPVGSVYIGFSSEDMPSQSVKLKMLSYSRDAGRRRFTTATLILARLYAEGANIIDTVKGWKYI